MKNTGNTEDKINKLVCLGPYSLFENSHSQIIKIINKEVCPGVKGKLFGLRLNYATHNRNLLKDLLETLT